jgi:phage terminase large subunit-like protein
VGISPSSAPPDDPFVAAVLRALPGYVDTSWLEQARPDQRTPPGDWNIWLVLAGRGWGKTRVGAEDTKAYALANPGSRIAVVAPTFSDARDTCIEGESGLLSVLPADTIGTWNRSLGELVLRNGSRFKLFSADEPERLRGPQHHRAWCDELGAWRYADAWDQLMFGLRLGTRPQVIVTTTPRPIPLVKGLLERDDVHVTRGRTLDNAANLAPAALQQLLARYEGTRLGRQELEAELLEEMEGALWRRAWIDRGRVKEAPDLTRVTVGVDPSGGAGEQGITVVGKGADGHGYVLADRTCSLHPDGWGRRAVQAWLDFEADDIVVETNYGGDMAVAVLRGAAQRMADQGHPTASVPIKVVTASRGKRVRAEPVAAMYEVDPPRFHHVGSLPDLEDQLVSWAPEAGYSPDRLDSMVWGAWHLGLVSTANLGTGSFGGLSVVRSSLTRPAGRGMIGPTR